MYAGWVMVLHQLHVCSFVYECFKLQLYIILIDVLCSLFDLNIAKNDRAGSDSDGMSNHADMAGPNESIENVSQIKRKKKKRSTRMQPNIASNRSQLDAPLSTITPPDDLTSKLNFLSGDAAASSRLFITVLTTKQSDLRLSSGERFIDLGVPVSVEVYNTTY